MDPTTEFFAKLKKVCGKLETETARLRQTFDSRHENVDSELGAKAMQAFHEVNCDTLSLKSQLQESLRKQKSHKNEMDTLIQTFTTVESRLTHDVHALRELFEKYGYHAPTDTKAPNGNGEELEDKESGKSVPEGEQESGQDEEGDSGSKSPPDGVSSPDHGARMRTPKLSDFGLCELQLSQKLLGCSQLPAMPEIHLPHVNMCTPKLSNFGLCELQLSQKPLGCSQLPAMPEIHLPRVNMRTPLPPSLKCALVPDEDEPQMIDFGISEETLCLNEFTMDLLRKKPTQNQPAIAVSPQKEDCLMSPEPPVFCTPGLQVKKIKSNCSSPPRGAGGHAQLQSAAVLPIDIPEVPAFQTPFLKRMLSNKKDDFIVAKNDHEDYISLSHSPHDGSVGDGPTWEYDVPEFSIPGVHPLPLSPDPMSTLVNTPSTYLDGATQDFYLSPPRCIRESLEMPEMPELSSVTQDICKLVLQSEKKAEPKSRCMAMVSKQEFHSLSRFLKQITFDNLNQAIFSINNYLAQCPGEDTLEFGMEELKVMMNVDIEAPVYILCLSELKRLAHMRGERNHAFYKLNLHS
ncbi:SKA complex subunit 3 [Stigmatopora argus]